MQQELSNLLDDIHEYEKKNVIYPNEPAHIIHTLWNIGSYFLEDEAIKVFDNYPILAFLSPDEDSGKTRALDITAILAYNALDGGSYTAASLCREIDQRHPELITLILDELDETLVPSQDNAPYARLLNNGYQRGKYIVRSDLNNNKENLKTPAYCPKAIAGLAVTRLKKTTRSRMIIIRMRPMRNDESVQRHIDKEIGKSIAERILQLRGSVAAELKTIDEDSLSYLVRRAGQIYHPLLAIAKIAGDGWFTRATEAVAYYVDRQKPEDTLGKKILIELFRIYAGGRHAKGIWGETFADELHKLDFSLEIDKYKIAYYLGSNGYGIETRDLKIDHHNRKAYHWDDCLPSFLDYLSEELRDKIMKEVAAVADSSQTGVKASATRYQQPYDPIF